MDLSSVGRVLVVVGLVVVGLGALFLLAAALGVGSLPGDLTFRRGSLRVYVPIASCVVISIVGTILLNLLIRK